MTGIDIFAIFVLLVIVATVVYIWVALSMLPGQIAQKRGHPQAEAVNVCGWMGGLTMGILWPLAFIWAYMRPPAVLIPEEKTGTEETKLQAAPKQSDSELENRPLSSEQKGEES